MSTIVSDVGISERRAAQQACEDLHEFINLPILRFHSFFDRAISGRDA